MTPWSGLGSGEPAFSQAQCGHDVGVYMGHRPLPIEADWSQPSCLRKGIDLGCMHTSLVVVDGIRARK